MVLKVSYSNQIHRIAKTPASYKELSQLVAHLFQNQLPERWTLQYVDSDGDAIMLSDEHDFQNLLEGELTHSTKAVKVLVIPVDGINQSQVNAREFADEASESQVEKHDDEFQVIEKQEVPQVEEPKVEQQEVAEEPKVEQPVEESVQKEEPKVEEVAQEVAKPEMTGELRRKIKKSGHKLKKILKKLSKTDLSAERKELLEAKLRKFEGSLTAEEQEIFTAKKKEFLRRRAEKKAKNDSEFKERVTDILYQYLPTIASLTKEYVQEDNKDKPQAQPVVQPKPEVKPTTVITHAGVQCDGCRMYPIRGIRYKCYTCPDFDFCENCEASKEHDHAFIKIKDTRNFRRNSQRGHHGPNPFAGGRGCWNPAGFNGWAGNRCNKPQQPKPEEPQQPKAEESNKKVEEPKVPEVKNIFDILLGKLPEQATENKEKVDFKIELPAEDLKKELDPLLNILPPELKNFANLFLGSFAQKPEEKKEEAKPEEKIEVPKAEELKKEEEPKKEEVVIAEEPVVNEVKAEVIENGPVIQVVENVPEIVKEDPKPIKKEYSEGVKSKVATMMEIFPDANEEELLEFVSKTPNLAIQELVENYLA